MQLKNIWLRFFLAAVASSVCAGVASADALTKTNNTTTNKFKQVSYCNGCQTGCQHCAPQAPCVATPAYTQSAPAYSEATPTHPVESSGVPSQIAAPSNFSLADPGISENQFAPVAAAQAAQSASYGLAAIGGYIEPASVQSRFRLSWSDYKRSDSPDRAQYFYGYADSSDPGLIGLGNGVNADGPDYNALIDNGNVREPSFSEVHAYFEQACFDNNISLFIDVPFRHTSGFNFNDGDTGIGDVVVGSRLSLVETCDFAFTAIAKAYIPTGNVTRARGTGHGSIEYGVLFQKQLSNDLTVFGQLTDWFSTEDTLNEAQSGNSNVLQYGLGIGYQVYEGCCGNRRFAVTPVAEFVGWSVLEGRKHVLDVANNSFTFGDAEGDFIANGKYGVRVDSGASSLYGGYGHNLTDEHWYREIVRFEYTRRF